MVDALTPACDALDDAARRRRRPRCRRAGRGRAAAADAGRDATTPMQARKGRASYLGERSVGHQDPGATSAALLVTAAATARRRWRDGPPRGRVVVVSHSRALAEAAVALAPEMVHGQTSRVEVAAGLDDGAFGTDAVAIVDAITRADGGAGVVVLMDLGSAVLSTEMALELLDDDARERVVLCPAPLVEGLVVAVVAAAGGADRAEVAAEAAARWRASRPSSGPVAATAAAIADGAPVGRRADRRLVR